MIQLLILLLCNISFAYEFNVYSSSRPGYILVEAIDDCNFSHKLLIPEAQARTHKPGDWLELLIISGEWNKCKKLVD